MSTRLHVKYMLFFSDFNASQILMKLEFSGQSVEKYFIDPNIIIHIRIHSFIHSFCVLKFVLSACRPKFAEVSRTTWKVEAGVRVSQ
jgi:hypothetical protein